LLLVECAGDVVSGLIGYKLPKWSLFGEFFCWHPGCQFYTLFLTGFTASVAMFATSLSSYASVANLYAQPTFSSSFLFHSKLLLGGSILDVHFTPF